MMQSRSQETRSQILESAAQLFSDKGYSETSVSEICASAEISKGAFYYHFVSKQELFLALLENWLENLDSAFQLIHKDSKNVPEAILAMATMTGSVLQSSDTNTSILLEFWMQAHRDPIIWEAAIAPYQRYIRYFTNLYQKGLEEGSLKEIEPETTARITVSLGLGILLQALFDPSGTRWDITLLQSMKILIESISREQF